MTFNNTNKNIFLLLITDSDRYSIGSQNYRNTESHGNRDFFTKITKSTGS